MVLPIAKVRLLLGYMLAFGLLAIVRLCLPAYSAHGLGLEVQGPSWFLIVMALVDALLGTALGLL